MVNYGEGGGERAADVGVPAVLRSLSDDSQGTAASSEPADSPGERSSALPTLQVKCSLMFSVVPCALRTSAQRLAVQWGRDNGIPPSLARHTCSSLCDLIYLPLPDHPASLVFICGTTARLHYCGEICTSATLLDGVQVCQVRGVPATMTPVVDVPEVEEVHVEPTSKVVTDLLATIQLDASQAGPAGPDDVFAQLLKEAPRVTVESSAEGFDAEYSPPVYAVARPPKRRSSEIIKGFPPGDVVDVDQYIRRMLNPLSRLEILDRRHVVRAKELRSLFATLAEQVGLGRALALIHLEYGHGFRSTAFVPAATTFLGDIARWLREYASRAYACMRNRTNAVPYAVRGLAVTCGSVLFTHVLLSATKQGINSAHDSRPLVEELEWVALFWPSPEEASALVAISSGQFCLATTLAKLDDIYYDCGKKTAQDPSLSWRRLFQKELAKASDGLRDALDVLTLTYPAAALAHLSAMTNVFLCVLSTGTRAHDPSHFRGADWELYAIAGPVETRKNGLHIISEITEFSENDHSHEVLLSAFERVTGDHCLPLWLRQ